MESEKYTSGAVIVVSGRLSFTGDIDTVSSQIVMPDPVVSTATFQLIPLSVPVKYGLPIGGHIQKLIRAIKGDEE